MQDGEYADQHEDNGDRGEDLTPRLALVLLEPGHRKGGFDKAVPLTRE